MFEIEEYLLKRNSAVHLLKRGDVPSVTVVQRQRRGEKVNVIRVEQLIAHRQRGMIGIDVRGREGGAGGLQEKQASQKPQSMRHSIVLLLCDGR